MAAFERVLSGIHEMDHAPDNIRLGDNVVWQVTKLEEFYLFLNPYVTQAVRDRRKLIYVRFASHEPLVTEQPGVRIVPVELSHRFENFTVEIHNLIEREGEDAFYVFDCLSELLQITTAVTSKEKHQFSQRRIDVIDTEKGLVEGKDLSWLERELPLHLKHVLLEHDWDAETDFRNRGQNREIFFVSCEGLVKNEIIVLEDGYEETNHRDCSTGRYREGKLLDAARLHERNRTSWGNSDYASFNNR